MTHIRIKTEGRFGEESEFEGEAEEAHEEIRKQEETFRPSVEQPAITEAEIEGFSGEVSEDDYDDLLDEIYPEVKIGNSSFLSSTILKELDPIAYRIGRQEYSDSRVEDLEYNLQSTGEITEESQTFWDDIFDFLRG